MNSSFDRPGVVSRPPAASQGWESTRVQTQVSPRVGDTADDDEADRDIGRAVGNHQRELFVSCEPAEALTQQFDHLNPEYVAVHDLGTSASRKLLGGIAAAAQRPLQRLVIRRPGGGTTLATLEFVDCPAANGSTVRLYSTAVDADTATRQALARVLLGRARLGIVMVGDLPAHALASALDPWRDAVIRGGWNCRRMLFMPLAAGAALPGEIVKFRSATAIDAHATSQVTRPADVWSQLYTAWNALQRQLHPGAEAARLPLLGGSAPAARPAAPAPSAAPAWSAPPTPMPVIGAAAPSRDAPLERYLHDVGQLAGVLSACVFDLASGQPVGHAGSRPGPEDLARHGNALLAAMMTASRSMGLGAVVPETTITLGQHHLLLRPVPAHPGLALHLVLDKPHATLALVQVQLRRLEGELMVAAKAGTTPLSMT